MIEAMQIGKDGKLGPLKDICIVAAQKYMFERWGNDTHPSIVQMILHEKLVPHWYYRSDQWVAQPYYFPQYFLQPYVGPKEDAPSYMYGEDTYVIDKQATQLSIKLIEGK